MSRCSMAWSRADLPAWGTAARAKFYVCLEMPGPWGPDAPTTARMLDPVVGKELDDLAKSLGGRLLLIRHAERRTIGRAPLTVIVSGAFDEGGWTRRFSVTDPRELIDWLRVWAGQGVPAGDDGGAAMLICSHARRDQCCALAGRPILAALGGSVDPQDMWEASHLGGHRFAPTMLLLPTGQVLGRLNAVAAITAYHAAQERVLYPGGARKDRGRSHLPPVQQAAEAWALNEFGPIEGSRLSSTLDGDTVRVVHGDQRASVRVDQIVVDDEAPPSCGKPPEPMSYWDITPIDGPRRWSVD